ncbi:DEAD/DEAH box helicase [Breoghania sp. L-A4]|uniref:DEAD/DEAH box helicase n=1 Tax=Breoghania sp. L-A4 TaxID=2304600 RepID=UPI000E35B4E6|nr:DEAD/DEAH box helicase [Breoghania sp. L-A4]AXS42816.1 DEAD/DEAH box helicase [Breoghania sp. L-A4]
MPLNSYSTSIVPTLARALSEKGYTDLTPVQSAVIEADADGRDLLVSAQTGSGKTVAFGLAIAPTLLEEAEIFGKAELPLALVVAPTRELALQVCREIEWLYAPAGAKVVSCVGGMEMRVERRALNFGAHIVVGTPGRLRDHLERGSLDASQLKCVVLDEADEMLDLGFREDLEFILDAAPSERRTLMFSATVAKPIADLAKRFQNNALRISTVSEREQHVDIDYKALRIAPNDKENAIINALRFYEAGAALVFCSTRETVKRMSARLLNRGFSTVALSGELSQNERTHALQALRDGRAKVCVATDVAARGIDLPNLDLVIHADLPTNKETLLHRSGRTGRAGRKGTCVLLVPHNRRRQAERLLGSAGITASWEVPPSATDILQRDRERLLADPAWDAEADETVREFADALMASKTADQIALAYARLYRDGQPAPEELLDVAPFQDEPARPAREEMQNGVWFRMNVGRKHNAEPRWLLPLICRRGHVTKKEIGSIRIQENETLFEMEPRMVDRFLTAIAKPDEEDSSVRIERLAPGETPAPRPGRRERETGAGYKPKSFGPKKFGPKRDGAAARTHTKKPHRGK